MTNEIPDEYEFEWQTKDFEVVKASFIRKDLYTALEQRNARLVEVVEGYYNCYKMGEYTALNEKAKQALAENKE